MTSNSFLNVAECPDAAMAHVQDRHRNYAEFLTGVRLRANERGLWNFQEDCARWLLQDSVAPLEWKAGQAVVCGRAGCQSVRFGILVAPAGDGWRVEMSDTYAHEVWAVDRLWQPRGCGSRAPAGVLAVLLPPGFGKTRIAATALSRYPSNVTALYVTQTGLLHQTLQALEEQLGIMRGKEGSAWRAIQLPTSSTLVSRASSRTEGVLAVTTYSLLRRADCDVVFDSFDSIYFDEAHTATAAITRALSRHRDADWWWAYPRIVLLSGSATALAAQRCYRYSVRDVFYMSKTPLAPRCLNMPELVLEFRRHARPGFDIREYVRKLLQSPAEPYVPLVWWAYERCSTLWSCRAMARLALDAIVGAMNARMSVPPHCAREAALTLLREGYVFAHNVLAAQLQEPPEWTAKLRSPPPRGALSSLPPPQECVLETPLCDYSFFRRAIPALMARHRGCLGAEGHSVEHIVRAAQECLRGGDGPAPKVLLCLSDVPEEVSTRLLRRLLNYPDRNIFCGARRDCPGGCSKSHDSSRFRVAASSKVSLKDPREAWCLRKLAGEKSGELFDAEGVDAAHVFLMFPSMLEQERRRVVAQFNALCHAPLRALAPLVEQARRSTGGSPFLRLLSLHGGALAQVLRRFVDVPQLHIAQGRSADIGWNFQQRQTEILSLCHADAGRMQQQIGRLQRPARGGVQTYVPPVRYSMLIAENTVEDFVHGDMLRGKTLHQAASLLRLQLGEASAEAIRKASVGGGRKAAEAAQELLSYRRKLQERVCLS